MFCRAVLCCCSSLSASTLVTPAPPRSCQWRWAELSVSTLSPRSSQHFSSGPGLASPTSPQRSVGSHNVGGLEWEGGRLSVGSDNVGWLEWNGFRVDRVRVGGEKRVDDWWFGVGWVEC